MMIPFMIFMGYGNIIAPIFSISYEIWLNSWIPVTIIGTIIVMIYQEIYRPWNAKKKRF